MLLLRLASTVGTGDSGRGVTMTWDAPPLAYTEAEATCTSGTEETDALNPNVASTGWRAVNSWLCGSAGML